MGSEVMVRSGFGFPLMLVCQNVDIDFHLEQNLKILQWFKFLNQAGKAKFMTIHYKHFPLSN